MPSSRSNDTKNDSLIPQLFLDAMAVREEVFVKEQGVPAENEVDEDEEKSWHWVVFAGPSVEGQEVEGQEGEEEDDGRARRLVPVGTVRLVPPPHHHQEQYADTCGIPPSSGNKQEREPYVKLTRLAILGSYRRRGLAARLTRECLDWAAAHASEIDRAAQSTLSQISAKNNERAKYQKWQGLVRIHAQVGAVPWYEGQGFELDKDEHGKVKDGWDEEGIPHLGMWKRVKLRDHE